MLHKFVILFKEVRKWEKYHQFHSEHGDEDNGAADSQSPLRDMVRSTLLHLGLLDGLSGKTGRFDISRNFANCFQDWCGLWPDR